MSAATSKIADANARRPAGIAARVSEAVDLHYIAEYEQKLASEIETLERARARIDSLRLQIKQAKRHAADLKRNMTLREFVRLMPYDAVRIEPWEGGVQVAVRLSPMAAALYRSVPEQLGLEFVRSERVGNGGLCDPVCFMYRSPGGVNYYVTEEVR